MLAAWPAVAGAQNLDRTIERMAERISAAAQRAAERASQAVERAMREYDADLDDDDFDSDRRDSRSRLAEERIDTTFAFDKGGIVDLSSLSGEIVVTGWSRSEARIRAVTERGRFRSNLSPSRITIEAEPVRGRTGETHIEVSIPEGVRVVLRSISGDLTTRGTGGPVEASTTSGDVIVDKAVGRVTLESVSGDVQGGDISGDVEATSVSGEVTLEGVRGAVRVESTSGEISLTDVQSTDVYASTVSGSVDYQGSVDGNGRYEFHSHSGDVTLDVPRSVSAHFSVETYSGSLDSDFPVTLQPGERTNRRPRRFEFTVGGGAARVIAESFSGDVRVSQRGSSR